MNRAILVVTISFLFFGCEKDKFDLNNPDVKQFVTQLKNGTYDCYEIGENGEKLWLKMPNFTKDHISSLLQFSKDTSHILNYPVNPVSSRSPLPIERDYFILGECLLWTIEGIRNNSVFGSLDPYLIDLDRPENEVYKGLKAKEILTVRTLYEIWWNNYKNNSWQKTNPLEGSHFRWM